MPVINHRRNNKISYFKDTNDRWITNHDLIVNHALAYFTECFSTSHLSTAKGNYGSLYNRISSMDMSILDSPLMDFKVKNALFLFKPFKAPGPDGFYPHFYQYFWNTVGTSVLDLCHQDFALQTIPLELNKTYLCLIMKFTKANQLKNFLHIGQCNTIYKIITKFIANRIKPLLPNLIGPHQTNFLKGRRACDNAILVQEIFNYINKTPSTKGCFLLKLYLAKAFDHLE